MSFPSSTYAAQYWFSQLSLILTSPSQIAQDFSISKFSHLLSDRWEISNNKTVDEQDFCLTWQESSVIKQPWEFF